ncbi:branched-chain amino acid ABC transporter permease [Pseudonocardia ailaonensis]|uniref:Branched-chain amino acid ABC transporter permease n=1 Tax=Pseudonocardia ailaonensis TaxID=367279 RepID=A0ABN2N7Q6_9PSEU
MATVIVGLCVGSIFALMACSIVVVHRGTHLVNFAQGEIAALGVFFYIQWVVLDGGRPVVAIVAGILIVGVLGLLFGIIAGRMARTGDHLVPLISSFGLFLATRSITVGVWGPGEPYQIPPLFGGDGWQLGGELIPFSYLFVLGVSVVCAGGLYAVARFTTVGLRIRALVENRDAAEVMGIPTARLQLATWFVGTALAAVATFLFFQNNYVVTGSIDSVLIPAFAIAAVGGFEHFGAVVLASAVYGVGSQLMSQYLTFAGNDVLSLVILVVLLFLMPRGILVAKSARYSS